MAEVLKDLSSLTLARLQRVIEARHPASVGRPAAFDAIASKSTNGQTAIINLTYATPSAGLPASLFLKICGPDERFIPGSECDYYARDYIDLADPPIPTCYEAAVSRADGSYHLLLEDLSKTHYSNKDIPPTRPRALAVAVALARLHSHKWGSSSKDTGRQIDAFVRHASEGLSRVMDRVRPDLSLQHVRTVERILEVHPSLMKKRAEQPLGMTLVHGDPNPSNVLSPHSADRKTYIVDRQPFIWSLTNWVAVSDLAYLAVTYWDANERREHERAALDMYHQALQEFGVAGYSWEACIEDYRLCVPHGIYTAMGWGTQPGFEQMEWLWRKQLMRSLAGLSDWDYAEVLQ